jgi:hypothetical protein
MANEQNKGTKNTSGVDNQSTNLTDTKSTGTSNFGTGDSETMDLGGGEFGNAGTVNADFSDTGSSTKTPSTTGSSMSGSSTIGSSTSGTSDTKTGSTGDQSGSLGLSTDSVKETAKGLYDSAKNTAGQAFGAATKRATEALDERKVTVASGLTSVADSIKQVGENLSTSPEHNPIADTAAKYTNTIAQQIENLSGYFERKDVRDMVRDVETFARRNPAYFIGGAVALGFLAARFLKSSNPRQLRGGTGRTFNEGYDPERALTAGNTTPGSSQF